MTAEEAKKLARDQFFPIRVECFVEKVLDMVSKTAHQGQFRIYEPFEELRIGSPKIFNAMVVALREKGYQIWRQPKGLAKDRSPTKYEYWLCWGDEHDYETQLPDGAEEL